MHLAIIADDLTGANDSGAQVVRSGMSATVCIGTDIPQVAGACVIDTDSRALTAEQAYQRTAQAARLLLAHAPAMIYKKMDSTLRGNIGAELDALDDVLSPELIVIAPAYPAAGRTVQAGRLYVDGVPVDQTEFARDPKTPVHSADVAQIIAHQSARQIGHLTLADLAGDPDQTIRTLQALIRAQIRYVVCDSMTDTDLQRLAAALSALPTRCLWAGSAGLAAWLPQSRLEPVPQPLATRSAACEASADTWQSASDPAATIGERRQVLLVVGSVSARSREQLHRLQTQADVHLTAVDAAALTAGGDVRQAAWQQALAAAQAAWAAGRHVALYATGGRDDVSRVHALARSQGMRAADASAQIADALGELAVRLLADQRPSGIIATGGDTARRVFQRLGATAMQLTGELEPGVPHGRLEPIGVRAITKAGGFGSPDVLLEALRTLEKMEEMI